LLFALAHCTAQLFVGERDCRFDDATRGQQIDEDLLRARLSRRTGIGGWRNNILAIECL
jgi:hypothetical protein